MKDFDNTPPVALLIFNRPDFTRMVAEVVAWTKPSKLLVVADGPRADNPEDLDRCSITREIIDRIDWDCEVLKNYSEENMGRRDRISSGLDWVFDNVEEAIILEDDCVPHPSFFRFCRDLIKRYRDDLRIMMISGGNYQNGVRRTPYSYYFSKFFHIWGWATWRRAWKHYDVDMKTWEDLRSGPWLRSVLGNAAQTSTFRDKFDDMKNGADCWDYRWVFACWLENSLSIIPNKNLVTNIGFPRDRACSRYHPFGHLPAGRMIFPLKHPPFIERQVDADTYEFRIEYGGLRRTETLRRFRNTLAYYRKYPVEIWKAPYFAFRALAPPHVRSEMRRWFRLHPNGPLKEAIMDRYRKRSNAE